MNRLEHERMMAPVLLWIEAQPPSPERDAAAATVRGSTAAVYGPESAQPCGCDPGASHHCESWPECAYGRAARREREIQQWKLGL